MAHVRVLPQARVWVLGGGWGLRLPWRLVLAGVMQVLWQPLGHSVCVPEPLGWTWRMPRGWEAALLRAEARSPPHQGRWLRRLPGWLSEPGLGLGSMACWPLAYVLVQERGLAPSTRHLPAGLWSAAPRQPTGGYGARGGRCVQVRGPGARGRRRRLLAPAAQAAVRVLQGLGRPMGRARRWWRQSPPPWPSHGP